MRLSVKRKAGSGQFVEQIGKLVGQLSSTKIAAEIVVPDSMSWWYWQEFGTATRGDAGYASGRTYDDPSEPTGFAFPDALYPNAPDGYRVGEQLHNQPGIFPAHFVQSRIKTIMQFVGHSFFESGHNSKYDPEAIRADFLENVMPNTIGIIAQSMAEALPGVRATGKLHGGTAAGAFETEAKVRNTGT